MVTITLDDSFLLGIKIFPIIWSNFQKRETQQEQNVSYKSEQTQMASWPTV